MLSDMSSMASFIVTPGKYVLQALKERKMFIAVASFHSEKLLKNPLFDSQIFIHWFKKNKFKNKAQLLILLNYARHV